MRNFKRQARVGLERGKPRFVLPGFENVTFVYLMGENQSFDRWHGALKQDFPQMDGVDPANPGCNDDLEGNHYRQTAATERLPMFGPEHSMADTAQQMNLGDMDGFVANFQRNYPQATKQDRQDIMSYFARGALPFNHFMAIHKLAVLFDHWFSDVPGPTWPNREMPFAGQTGGLVNMAPGADRRLEWLKKDLNLLFDELNAARVSWAYFYGDIPLALTLKHMRNAANASHLYPMKDFYEVMSGPAKNIPRVIVIEPTWYQSMDEGADKPNSDLWPADPFDGQLLQKRIYEALRQSAVWPNVVFLSTKDEHGGYYDHVYPPKAVPPGAPGPFGEFGFNQLGLRVPTLLISPLADGGLNQDLFSATSWTRTLCDVFKLTYLTDRVAHASSLVPLFTRLKDPRTDFPYDIEVNECDMPPVSERARQKAHDSFMGDFGRDISEALHAAAVADGPRWYGGAKRIVLRLQHLRLRSQSRHPGANATQLAHLSIAARQVRKLAENARRHCA